MMKLQTWYSLYTEPSFPYQNDTYLLRTDGKNYVNRNNKEGLCNISCKGPVYLKLLIPKQEPLPPSQ